MAPINESWQPRELDVPHPDHDLHKLVGAKPFMMNETYLRHPISMAISIESFPVEPHCRVLHR